MYVQDKREDCDTRKDNTKGIFTIKDFSSIEPILRSETERILPFIDFKRE